eukprot:1425799-Pleurochrysis_carterae.AAC.3
MTKMWAWRCRSLPHHRRRISSPAYNYSHLPFTRSYKSAYQRAVLRGWDSRVLSRGWIGAWQMSKYASWQGGAQHTSTAVCARARLLRSRLQHRSVLGPHEHRGVLEGGAAQPGLFNATARMVARRNAHGPSTKRTALTKCSSRTARTPPRRRESNRRRLRPNQHVPSSE